MIGWSSSLWTTFYDNNDAQVILLFADNYAMLLVGRFLTGAVHAQWVFLLSFWRMFSSQVLCTMSAQFLTFFRLFWRRLCDGCPCIYCRDCWDKVSKCSFRSISKISTSKVSWGLGHLHAADGDPGHLLRQPQLWDGLATVLWHMYRLPSCARTLDVLDAKVSLVDYIEFIVELL